MTLAASVTDFYRWFERNGNTCARQTTMAVLVDTRGKAHFGFNECANPQRLCPRGNAPTGVAYHLCDEVCQQVSHAEIAAIRAAGANTYGGVLYLFGHTYVCQNCLRTMRNAGVVAYLCIKRKGNEWLPVTATYQLVPQVFPTS